MNMNVWVLGLTFVNGEPIKARPSAERAGIEVTIPPRFGVLACAA
jgi:hypothetical protein